MSPAPKHDSTLARDVAAFCQEQVQDAQQQRSSFPSSELWAAVQKTGTSLWLDTGDVAAARELWVREFEALTTNNTLLNKEVQKGLYDQLVPGTAKLLREKGVAGDDVVQEIAFVLNAVHGLKLVRTFDADVSVELHTAISNDGIRLNFTLGFSARQNWLIGMLARPTWVNVFMGRINAFVSDNKLGDGKNAGEKATLASQRGLRRMGKQGGPTVRQIGASMRNGQQVADLLGLDVFTMPTGAAKGYLDLKPAMATITDKTGGDPAVTFGDGIDAAKEGLNGFWEITAGFEKAAAAAAALDANKATAQDVLAALAANGAGDLFPQFSADEAARVAKEGKIPVYKSWCERVRAGTASWDGVLTAAALASFTEDQTALDDRIRGLI